MKKIIWFLAIIAMFPGCKKIDKESKGIEITGKTSYGREWDGSLMPGESMTFELEIGRAHV